MVKGMWILLVIEVLGLGVLVVIGYLLLRRLRVIGSPSEHQYWKKYQRTSTILCLVAWLIPLSGSLIQIWRRLDLVMHGIGAEVAYSAMEVKFKGYSTILSVALVLLLFAGGWYERKARELIKKEGIDPSKK